MRMMRIFIKSSPRRNPIAGEEIITNILNNFTNVKTRRVLRGGSWSSIPNFLRVAIRNKSYPSLSYDYVGFRCARTVAP